MKNKDNNTSQDSHHASRIREASAIKKTSAIQHALEGLSTAHREEVQTVLDSGQLDTASDNPIVNRALKKYVEYMVGLHQKGKDL